MKNFTRTFIGLLAFVFAISFKVNAQIEYCTDEEVAQGIVVTCSSYNSTVNNCNNWHAGYMEYIDLYYDVLSEKAELQNQIASLQNELNWSLSETFELENQITSLQYELYYSFTQADVDAAYASGAASVTPEDGISQADVDNATPLSINIPLDLPQGWSMLGYTCVESTDVVDALADVVNAVEIVKDEMGLSYLPSWNFNAIGYFKYAEGYQIKLYESINDLSFCSTLRYKLLGCTDQTAFNFNIAANTDDGSCVTVIEGCTDQEYFEYNINANTDDGSCEILSVFGCTDTEDPNYEESANVNDGSCVLNVGCTNPEASNYDPVANDCANEWDCECTYETYGCTNSGAVNYNSEATINKGCVYQLQTGPNCSSLEILSTVTNAFDNLPSGISVQDEVSFSIDLNSSEWSVGSDQNNDDFFFDESSIGSNFTTWQSAHPVSYTISYTSGYSESGQITSINVIDGGINLYASTYYYNQGGEWIMDWTNGQDKIEFYDGDTKIYDMQMGEDANLSYASNIGDVASALTNTYVSGTFYWANYQVSTPWTTYHQDFTTVQGSTSFSVTENDCTGCTDTQSFNFDSNAVIDNNSCIPIQLGCIDANYIEYDVDANTDDGSCETIAVVGCQDPTSFNYNSEANLPSECTPFILGCIQESQCNYNSSANTDDGTCYNNDVGCGCDVPLPEEGYNCQGNIIIGEIGDTVNGGILFYLDETGQHGLIADFEDLGFLPWQTGVNACNSSTNAGYDDWYLPTINELELLINTLALNNNNIMNLDFNHEWAGYYWSSTLNGNRVYRSRIYGASTDAPSLSITGTSYPEDSYFVRAIRSF